MILLFRDRRQKIQPDVLHVIGNTPLVKLTRIPKEEGILCDMCKYFSFFLHIKNYCKLSHKIPILSSNYNKKKSIILHNVILTIIRKVIKVIDNLEHKK